MKKTFNRDRKSAFWIIGVVFVCALIFFGIQNISSVIEGISALLDILYPLILGAAIAIILNVPMKFFESHLFPKAEGKFLNKIRRPLAFTIAVLIIAAILVGIIMLVIPELVAAVKIIVDGAVDFIKRASEMTAEDVAEVPFGEWILKIDFDLLLERIQGWLKDQGGSVINSAFATVGTLFGGIMDFVIAFIFSIYLIFSKTILKRQTARVVRAWMPKKIADSLIHALGVLNNSLRNFIAGQAIEAVILGSLCVLGMLLLRIPYAPMVGTLVGVTALIPVVGAFLGAGIGAFMILTVDPMKALIFLIFILILQQIEGNVIYPKVMGNRVKLPSMWMLAAVTVGGGLGGAVGMLVSVPLASTAYILFKEATVAKEKKTSENAGCDSMELFEHQE